MADYPGKQYVDRIGDAADSAIKWAKDRVNVPDDIKRFEDYLLDTRSSSDEEPWGNPYFKEDPERPGNIVSSDGDYDGRYDHIYEPNEAIPGNNGEWEKSYFPPSSGDVARLDQAKLKGFADNVKALHPLSPVKNVETRRAIAEDLNMDLSDVGSLPRTALRELVRQYGPGASARPYPEDEQPKFQIGWDYEEDWALSAGESPPGTKEEARELYLKYRKPKMQEFDHPQKKKAREEWDYDKMMENYSEGIRVNEGADRLEARHHANYRGDPARGRRQEYRQLYPDWNEIEELDRTQEDNELLAIEAGMGLSDKDFRVERD